MNKTLTASTALRRRHLLSLAGLGALGLALPGAHAAAPASGKLAILSMAGHDIELVEHVQQIGSRMPPKRQRLPLGTGLLDQRATLALDQQARAFVPAQDIVLLSAQGSGAAAPPGPLQPIVDKESGEGVHAVYRLRVKLPQLDPSALSLGTPFREVPIPLWAMAVLALLIALSSLRAAARTGGA